MDTAFELSLESVEIDKRNLIFRLAFASSRERLILPYPGVTGLEFINDFGEKIAEWKTRVLAITPLDEFVLRPGDRIAFDLEVPTKTEPNQEHDWIVQLPVGQFYVQYVYEVEADTQRYDFLAKRSRFAAITKQWGGLVKSPLIEFNISDNSM